MGQFGIGTYQPVSGYITVGQGFPTQPFSQSNPFAGNYGGQYGFIVDTRIMAPQQVTPSPIPMIGQDNGGLPVVRGFPQLVWAYTSVRPDRWYYFQQLYALAARTPPEWQYLVLLQYPDPTALIPGTLTQVLAHWDPPTHSDRTVGSFDGMTLTFKYVGQAQLAPGTPIVLLS